MFSVLSKKVLNPALTEDNLKEARLLIFQLSQFFLEVADTKIIHIRGEFTNIKSHYVKQMPLNMKQNIDSIA